MPPDPELLLTLAVLALGPAIFLRLTAREKRRRERHLEARLEEKAREARKKAERSKANAKDRPSAAEVTAKPAEPESTDSREARPAASDKARREMAGALT